MEFAADVVDFGTAPEVYVSGLKSIVRISPGVVRFTYFSEHTADDGPAERRVCLHVVADLQAWIESQPIYEMAVAALCQCKRDPRRISTDN